MKLKWRELLVLFLLPFIVPISILVMGHMRHSSPKVKVEVFIDISPSSIENERKTLRTLSNAIKTNPKSYAYAVCRNQGWFGPQVRYEALYYRKFGHLRVYAEDNPGGKSLFRLPPARGLHGWENVSVAAIHEVAAKSGTFSDLKAYGCTPNY